MLKDLCLPTYPLPCPTGYLYIISLDKPVGLCL
mgnify:CR=1 FL=1